MNEQINKNFLDNFYKAEKLYKEKKLLESLEIYKILYKENPNHVSVVNNIGLIYEKLKRFDESVIFYEKCNKLLPNQAIIIHNLANMYCRLERYIDAFPLLKKIINTNLKSEANYEKYALCLFYTQSKEETKNFIESVLSKFPKNIVLNGLLGKSLLHLNLHREGLEYIKKCTGFIEFDDNGVKYI